MEVAPKGWFTIFIWFYLFQRYLVWGMRGWGEERQRERNLLSTSSFPGCPQSSRLGQAKARNHELNASLPHGWQQIKYLGTTCFLPGSTLAGSLNPRVELALKSSHSDMCLNCYNLSGPQGWFWNAKTRHNYNRYNYIILWGQVL